MQFKVTVLLAILAVSTYGLPLVKRGGLVTLPLKRAPQTNSHLHPQLLLQQNINRASRRIARMTGRTEPTKAELTENLRKRILSLEGPEGLAKRYNRVGMPSAAKPSVNTDSLLGGKHKSRKGGKKAAAAAAAAAAGNATATAPTAGNTTAADPAAGNSTAGAGSSSAAPLDGVTAANTPSTADSLGLNIEGNDVGYLATIQMGTPPKDFNLIMDSGSADLWVGSEDCVAQDGGDCGKHNFLGTKGSSSFVDTKKAFQVTYGTGAVAGDIVTDDISVAGLALPAHTFGVALQETVDFSGDQFPGDGILGLAQSTLSEQKTLTPVEALAKAGLIKDAITSFKISRLADGKNDGEVTFGGLDATKFDSASLATLDNVNPDGFWEADMPAVTVDGTDLGLKGRTAILDTGTTLIIAPAADATAIHAKITGAKSDGQGGFTVPCTTTSAVALTFGTTSFAIDPRDLAFQPVDPADPTGDCVSGIASGNIGGAQEWLVGDVFLKNAYFSTDVTKNQLSLAKLV